MMPRAMPFSMRAVWVCYTLIVKGDGTIAYEVLTMRLFRMQHLRP